MSSSATKFILEIADATINAAKEDGCVERVLNDLLAFEQILESQPALMQALDDTTISFDKRTEALKASAQDLLHPYSINTILVCMQNNKLDYFQELNRALEQSARDKANFYRCSAVSSVEMSSEYKKRLEQTLEKKFNGSVRINYEINPAVLGGLEISCGDWRYRGTVNYKLQRLTKHLEM